MANEEKKKPSVAWRGTCLICKSLADFCYTLFVFMLAVVVCLLAYVMTLDETETPDILIRVIEDRVEARGARLTMSGIRVRPNGRLTIDHPVIYSADLQSEIARADLISARIDPALMFFGQTRFTDVEIVNGTITVPAMLSPSGTPQAIIDQIDLHGQNERQGWAVKHGKLRFGESRFTLDGMVNLQDLVSKQKPKEAKSLNEQLVLFYRQAIKARQTLDIVKGLEGRITLNALKGTQKSVDVFLTLLEAQWKDQVLAQNIEVEVRAALDASVRIDARIQNIKGPQDTFAKDLILQAAWSAFPTKDRWKPDFARLTLDSGGKEVTLASNIVASVSPLEGDDWAVKGLLNLGGSPWSLLAAGNPQSRTGSVALKGTVDPQLVTLATDIVKKAVPKVAHRPIESYAQIIDKPDIGLTAHFNGEMMPQLVEAWLDVGRIHSRGADFDRAIARARMENNYVEVPNLWLRSGPQNGWLSVGLDLDTMKRRLLIDGLFNPNLINDWIPDPWWTEFWENLEFQEEGFYCLMDSQQIIKRPDTLHLTGFAVAKDVIARGHFMNEIVTRMYILQRYFDMYDMDIARDEGYLSGEAQFAIDEDPRDGKFKMTGLWIDAESTADLSIGPDLISEVRQSVEDILEPYGYQVPPYVKAVSSSVRHGDLFDYAVDIDIETDHDFSYFNYPLDSLRAKALIGNERASIRDVRARLADGSLEAAAEIRGEDIELKIRLDDAHFGDTLKASAEYFKANNDESTAHSISPEDLTSYGGRVNLFFQGKGIVGDSLSYNGTGTYQIIGADLHDIPLLGIISRGLESAGLPIATLKFDSAEGPFEVDHQYVEFPELRLKGPVAQIKTSGRYDFDKDDLDFKATLQPFRSIPLINIAGGIIDIFTGFFEFNVTGPISSPKTSLFKRTKTLDEAPDETVSPSSG